jgi:hypothetical protein
MPRRLLACGFGLVVLGWAENGSRLVGLRTEKASSWVGDRLDDERRWVDLPR